MEAATFTPIVLDLSQESEDWKVWRQGGIGSSDAPIIMGVSPWSTPLQLWERKTSRAEEVYQNPAMTRGKALEADARAEAEFHLGGDYQPACLVHPEYPFLRASLDGWSRDRLSVLEIKCPGKRAHDIATAGYVPGYYLPQLQHLLLVSGSSVCHYWSWTPETGGVLVSVQRDEPYIASMLAAEQAFWDCVQRDAPPGLTSRDASERTDKKWRLAALNYRRAKLALADTEKWEAEAKAELLTLANGQKSSGFGVAVSEREGAIAWKQAAADLADILGEPIDTEKYRGKPAMTVRLLKES